MELGILDATKTEIIADSTLEPDEITRESRGLRNMTPSPEVITRVHLGGVEGSEVKMPDRAKAILLILRV